MMLVRNVKSFFYKILTGYGFYICIIFTFVLCFSADIYEAPGNGSKYSAIMALIHFDRNFMKGDLSFCSFEVMQNGAGSWLSLFIPIVASFSFVPLICDEYETKSVRIEIIRSSKRCYHTSRVIAACLSGGAAVMLGFGMFAAVEYAIFPNINEYETEMRIMYWEMLSYQYPNIMETGFASIIVQKLAAMFLYGAVCAVPAMMLTSIIRNKYLVLCIPFFMKYAVNQTCLKVQRQAAWIVNPDALAKLSEYGKSKSLVLIYNSSIIFMAIAVYLIVSMRKVDSGE